MTPTALPATETGSDMAEGLWSCMWSGILSGGRRCIYEGFQLEISHEDMVAVLTEYGVVSGPIM